DAEHFSRRYFALKLRRQWLIGALQLPQIRGQGVGVVPFGHQIAQARLLQCGTRLFHRHPLLALRPHLALQVYRKSRNPDALHPCFGEHLLDALFDLRLPCLDLFQLVFQCPLLVLQLGPILDQVQAVQCLGLFVFAQCLLQHRRRLPLCYAGRCATQFFHNLNAPSTSPFPTSAAIRSRFSPFGCVAPFSQLRTVTCETFSIIAASITVRLLALRHARNGFARCQRPSSCFAACVPGAAADGVASPHPCVCSFAFGLAIPFSGVRFFPLPSAWATGA